MAEQDLVVVDVPSNAFALPSPQEVTVKLQAIAEFRKVVQHELIEGNDFGVIPGTESPTLLKPGAEKIAKLLELADSYAIIESIQDWEKGFFHYIVECRLTHIHSSKLVSSGLGSCNSLEDRYRWRHQSRKCPTCGEEAIITGRKEYGGGFVCFKKKGGCNAKFDEKDPAILSQKTGRVPNNEPFTLVNTLLKMARKRALVDAALSAGRLSDVFTQDLEDRPASEDTTQAPEAPQDTPKPAPASPETAPVGSKPVDTVPDGPAPPTDVSGWSIPKNIGELFTWALKAYELKKPDTLKLLGVDDQMAIADVGQAWQTIVYHKGQDKAREELEGQAQ